MKILKLKDYSQINESFFNKTDDLLENLIKSFRSLFLNLKASIDYEFKIDFFKDNIKSDLNRYHNHLTNNYKKEHKSKFESEFKKLISEIDTDLIKDFKLDEFLEEILKIFNDTKNSDAAILKIEKVFNEYSTKIDGKISRLMNRIKDKIKNDEFYEPLSDGFKLNSSISYDEFMKQKYFLSIELLKLQEYIMDENKKILIIFEGRDAAGKGSLVDNMTEDLNNKGYRVEFFGIPTEEERENWFKRYMKVLPKKGEIVFFDRSWYTRAYVEPVMGYCTDKEYKKFMTEVNDFEKKLESEGVTIIKLWLSISKETQSIKFELRKSNPLKYWKYTKNDEESKVKWNNFTKYINKMLKKCNYIPWIIIDANDQRSFRLRAIKKILNKFDYPDKIKYDDKGKKI